MIDRKIVASVTASLSLLAAPSAHGLDLKKGVALGVFFGTIIFGGAYACRKISMEDLLKLREECLEKFKKLTEVLEVIKLREGVYMLKAFGDQVIVCAKNIKDGVAAGYSKLSEVNAEQYYVDCRNNGVLSAKQFGNALEMTSRFISGDVTLREFTEELTNGAGGFVIRFVIKSVFGSFF